MSSNVRIPLKTILVPYWVDNALLDKNIDRKIWLDGSRVWDELPETAVLDTLAANISVPGFLSSFVLPFSDVNSYLRNRDNETVKRIFSTSIYDMSEYFGVYRDDAYTKTKDWVGGEMYHVVPVDNLVYIILGPMFDRVLRGDMRTRWGFNHDIYNALWKQSSSFAPNNYFTDRNFINHMKTSKFRS